MTTTISVTRAVEALIRARFALPALLTDPQPIPGDRWSDLPALLADLGYTRGAEVGVEQGRYAERLLTRVPGLALLCVDAWRAYPGYRTHVSQADLDGFYRATLLRLRPWNPTVRRGWSVEVATTVRDRSLDFVYIDANHTYPQVVADLAAWAPKVRPGGLVAGHDYGGRGDVAAAVTGYTEAAGIDQVYVFSKDASPSWCWVA